jgi:hypothetical protein
MGGRLGWSFGTSSSPCCIRHLDGSFDFARALVTLGEWDEALGQVWHVPNAETVTMRSFVQLVFQLTGRPARLRAAPRWGIAMAAPFNPTMRAVQEQLYQSERPLVADSTKFRASIQLGCDVAVESRPGNGFLVPGTRQRLIRPSRVPRATDACR